MAAIWILVLVTVTYLLTIAIVVIGQEVHPLLGVVLFGLSAYGAYKLFQMRMTRL